MKLATSGEPAGDEGVRAPTLSPAEVRQRAERWFEAQLTKLAKAHGTHWASNREWVEDYLKAQLRERLMQLRWRERR